MKCVRASILVLLQEALPLMAELRPKATLHPFQEKRWSGKFRGRPIYIFLVAIIVSSLSLPAQIAAIEPINTDDEETLPPPPPPELDHLGWVEKALITEDDFLVHAKLDTGADNCSLHATDLRTFKRNGKRWIEFTVHNRDGVTRTLKRKISRTATIKRAGGVSQERYVVKMVVCLGHKEMQVDVNLVDRSHLNYNMLIGRSFLAGNVLVDSSSTYIEPPSCKSASESGLAGRFR